MTRHIDKTGLPLIGLTLLVLVAFLAALLMQEPSSVALRHVFFAVGVLPLILAAMLYFVPVLTRSASAHGAMSLLPPAAFMLGIGVVFALSFRQSWLPGLAGCILLLVCVEIGWIMRRRARVLGTPHAGLNWYLYALAALGLALLMIVGGAWWPEHWADARNVHLHLNIFGFLGLTAIGTLRVLLPTVVGEPDPASALFLKRELSLAMFGALAIAFGAAYWWPLAVFGALAWIWTGIQMLSVLRRWQWRWLQWHSASTSLGAAALGWLLLVVAGAAHALGHVGSDALFAVLVFMFLLPLVTGATSHLLPVWRWPGRATAAQSRMRQRLVLFSGARVAVFWCSGLAGFWGYEYAFVPAAIAVATYLLQIIAAFVSVRGTN